MNLIKHEIFERSYKSDYEKDLRREVALASAIKSQIDAYTHFVTATFPSVVTEDEAVIAVNKALRSLDGMNQQRVRFFYELSLSPKHQYTSTVASNDGESSVLTRWHVHALVGGLSDNLKDFDVAHVFYKATGGIADVKVLDGSKRLGDYLASSNTGNRIGALQRTNDRNIIRVMEIAGHKI